MDVNGCHIVSEPASTPEGWTSTVTKDGVLKGPFETIQEAIRCAQNWTASPSPTVPVPQPKVQTTGEAVVSNPTGQPADANGNSPRSE
jgi:hypothetical protein